MSDTKRYGKFRALVIGATGAIGKETVIALTFREEIESVTAFVRNASTFDSSIPRAKVNVKEINFEKLSIDDFKGHDFLFYCLGSTIKVAKTKENFYKIDHDYTVNCAKLAKAAGITYFALVTSIGSNANSSNFYFKTKGQTEEDVKKENFEAMIIYRPSILEANRGASARFGEGCGLFCAKYICFCIGCCCSQYSGINVRTVALAMVNVAIEGQVKGIKVYNGSDVIEKLVKRNLKN